MIHFYETPGFIRGVWRGGSAQQSWMLREGVYPKGILSPRSPPVFIAWGETQFNENSSEAYSGPFLEDDSYGETRKKQFILLAFSSKNITISLISTFGDK
jgi:hypothetical protein